MGLPEHRAAASTGLRCAVVTVSDTRTLETDESGREVERLLAGGGHCSAGRAIVADDRTAIAGELRRRLADPAIQAVILTGGTGVSPRDVTPDVVRTFLDLELPGFGELFRALSHGTIGSAALLSRALGGIAAGKPVFCLPGSRAAVVLALEKLILPELGHLVGELRK